MSQLNEILRQLEATEANLVKLEKLWDVLTENLPSDIVFGSNPVYENACRSYEHILKSLPSIDNWKPTALPFDLNEIAQNRFDARELGMDAPTARISVELEIEKPGKELREYRDRFNQKRRELTRDELLEICNQIDALLAKLEKTYLINNKNEIDYNNIEDEDLPKLRNKIKQIDVLMGSSVSRSSRWSDIQRHLRYGQKNDLEDIINHDWPSIKAGITKNIYSADEPIPVNIQDLGELVASKPSGKVITKLNWDALSAEDFERLIFNLVTSEENYQNVEWLMHTNAPDRGRDLSCYKVNQDRLSGGSRQRMIIQCKHWLTKGISITDISVLKDQVKSSWEPPRIDILVIATTGRFTADAVNYVEKHNQSDSAITIQLWAESTIESILASNPALVAEFGLR
jgi:hypothetical protein